VDLDSIKSDIHRIIIKIFLIIISRCHSLK